MNRAIRGILIAAGAFTLITFIGLIVLHDTERPKAIWTDTTVMVAAWVAFGLVVAHLRRAKENRAGWSWIAAGLGSEAIGETIWSIYEVVLNVEVPFPGAADLFYLLGYPLLGIGMVLLAPRAEHGQTWVRAVLDGITMASAVFLVSWILVLRQSIVDVVGGDFGEVVVNLSYPTFDVLLAAIVLALVSRAAKKEVAPLALLGGGILVWVVGDSAYLLLELQGIYGTGFPTDVTWVIGYLLMGTATLFVTETTKGGMRLRPAIWQRNLPLFAAVVALATVTWWLAVQFSVDAVTIVFGLVAFLGLAIRQGLAIREVERLQRATQRSAETAQAYVENSSDMVMLIGADQQLIYGNPALESLTGRNFQKMQEAGPFDLLHPDDVPVASAALQDIIAHPEKTMAMDFRIRVADGSYRTVSAVGSNHLEDPAMQGILVNSRDVTEERRRLHEELQVEQLEQLTEERRRLLNGAAHVLNTPLTPVMLQLGTLHAEGFGPLTEKQKDALASVERNLKRLQETSEDIIVAFRIQSETIADPLRLDVVRLVDECVEVEGVEVQRQGDAGPAWAMAEPSTARRAVCALLRHAVRAPAETLHVRVQASPEIISVTVKEPRKDVTDERAKAYLDPFGQGLETRSGLSLYICRIAAEKQGGGLVWDDGEWVLTLPAADAGASASQEEE